MARISEEEINEIRRRANIVDIISSYLNVEKKGKNYVAVCPFHDDHSPSLVISEDKQIFTCFTCRTSGNVFSFIMEYENVNFLEALKIVANKIGYNLQIDNIKSSSNSEYKLDYEIMEFSKKFFINNMNTEESIEAKKYLHERGITDEIINEFNIGLALNDKDMLHKLLDSKKYSLDMQEDLGLINKYGLDIYDTFQNRIIIPIENLEGQVVGFTGRIFHNEDNTSKYLNTKETRIFKKGHILFNYHNAKDAIREAKKVIVVEGNMDAIKVSASGIKNVVALMGVALTKEQINIFKKLRVPIILCLDNDDAGFEATLKLGEILENAGIETKVVRLTKAKDPDEYIKAFGKEAYLDNINHAIKYLDFKIEYLKSSKNLNNIDELVLFVNEVLSSLKNADDLTKELVISKISKDYSVDAEILRKQINFNKAPTIEKKITKRKEKANRYDNLSSKILYAMMDNPEFIPIYKNKLGYFANKEERIIASEIVYYNKEYQGISIADFQTYVMDSDIKDKVNKIINDNMGLTISQEEFNKYIELFLKELKKQEIKELKEKIKVEMDINKKVELLEKLTNLKKGSVE